MKNAILNRKIGKNIFLKSCENPQIQFGYNEASKNTKKSRMNFQHLAEIIIND